MKKIRISLIAILLAFSFSTFAQSKIAHINTTELVAAMPEMNDANSELEKLAKTYETDIQTMAAELQSKVKQYDTEAAAQTDEEMLKDFRKFRVWSKVLDNIKLKPNKNYKKRNLTC